MESLKINFITFALMLFIPRNIIAHGSNGTCAGHPYSGQPAYGARNGYARSISDPYAVSRNESERYSEQLQAKKIRKKVNECREEILLAYDCDDHAIGCYEQMFEYIEMRNKLPRSYNLKPKVLLSYAMNYGWYMYNSMDYKLLLNVHNFCNSQLGVNTIMSIVDDPKFNRAAYNFSDNFFYEEYDEGNLEATCTRGLKRFGLYSIQNVVNQYFFNYAVTTENIHNGGGFNIKYGTNKQHGSWIILAHYLSYIKNNMKFNKLLESPTAFCLRLVSGEVENSEIAASVF